MPISLPPVSLNRCGAVRQKVVHLPKPYLPIGHPMLQQLSEFQYTPAVMVLLSLSFLKITSFVSLRNAYIYIYMYIIFKIHVHV